jgi:nucleotide-binding universal stress UspA family protein
MNIATERISHVTPAGRAALHYFAGRPLPAVEVLSQASKTGHEPLRILVPVNGSDSDASALHVTAEMAPRDTEILLLHTRSGPDPEQYPDIRLALSEAERFEQRIESERIFSRANAILASRGLISADQVVAQGKPAEVILRCASQMGAQLIVLAVSGASGEADARHVIDQATCAVLAARPRVAATLATTGMKL